jgi:excisionase family DNA binding protein
MINTLEEPTTTQLVNQTTLAKIIDCSPRTIANLTSRKAIPFIKVGRLIRFQPDRVIEALAGGAK